MVNLRPYCVFYAKTECLLKNRRNVGNLPTHRIPLGERIACIRIVIFRGLRDYLDFVTGDTSYPIPFLTKDNRRIDINVTRTACGKHRGVRRHQETDIL